MYKMNQPVLTQPVSTQIVSTISPQLLLRFLKTETESFPFLESFAREYSQKVSEDKKTPLFSKTTKYNSFPVRCQWKGEKKIEKSKNGEKNKKIKNNIWRTEKIKPLYSLEPIKITPFKVEITLETSILKILNKITENNMDKLIYDFLKVLQESENPLTVKIVAQSILEKVWYDKSFYNLYVSLCQTLWSHEKWMEKGYSPSISVKNKKKFYVKVFDKEILGPFEHQEEAEKYGKRHVHLRTVFLALCRDNFFQREQFIKESQEVLDSNQRYKLRRKLFGTVEIMGQFYKMGFLKEEVIHYLFLSLLHQYKSDEEKEIIYKEEKGAVYEEEIEALHLLWSIVKNTMPYSVFMEYKPIFEYEKTRQWCYRISFMLDDLIEFCGGKTLTSEKKENIKKEGKEKEEKEKIKIDEMVELCAEEKEKQLKNFIKWSREQNQEKIEEKIKEKINKYKTLNGHAEMYCFNHDTDLKFFFIGILKDAIEYCEHTKNHLKTFSYFEKYFSNNHSMNKNVIFSAASENLADLKIDAPKALENLAYIVGETTINTYNLLSINLHPSLLNEEPDDFDKEYEEEQYKEWKTVLNIAVKNYPDIMKKVTFTPFLI
jgi:hypothetical protein